VSGFKNMTLARNSEVPWRWS